MIVCKTCKIERDERNFKSFTKNGKLYYSKRFCKICLSVKNLKSNNLLSPKCLQFLKRIEAQRGFVSYIDAFSLAHYHIETFGYKETNIPVKEELSKMYKELINKKREDEINNI
jgi:hypothetical protein